MFVGGVGKHLFLHWILIPTQMTSTTRDTIVQYDFSYGNM
jgi:hypothetical protein